jgi:hypothetical protein
MKKSMTGAVGLIVGLMAPGFAQDQDNSAIPRDSVAFGRTYSELTAAWWQWMLSIPATAHPLFDTTADCNTGQTGRVFFLGGKFCATSGPPCNAGSADRTCTVPAGKALFFPVVNIEDSTLEESRPSSQTPQCAPEQPNPTINCMRKFTEFVLKDVTLLSVQIDGNPIPNVESNFRVQSPAFDFTLPASNNILNASGEGPFNGGTYSLAVADGFYVLLAPLSPGRHSLQFSAKFGTFPFTIKYHLTQQ